MSATGTASPVVLHAGIGQIVSSDRPGDTLGVLGLGSCIGLVMLDVAGRVAGLAHVMLPRSSAAGGPPGKFADTAVPALIDALTALGAERLRLEAVIAGGARMFGGSGGSAMAIGDRNAEAVRAALTQSRIRLRAADVGGGSGRTMHISVATGSVTVQPVGGTPVDLR